MIKRVKYVPKCAECFEELQIRYDNLGVALEVWCPHCKVWKLRRTDGNDRTSIFKKV